jgi:hypothetical protein
MQASLKHSLAQKEPRHTKSYMEINRTTSTVLCITSISNIIFDPCLAFSYYSTSQSKYSVKSMMFHKAGEH